jgi:large subunit ribosomal protein L18
MSVYKTKKEKRVRRHMRSRQKISGTAERPRLAVFFSQKHIHSQLVDDDVGKTLVSVSTCEKEIKNLGVKQNVEGAKKIGKIAAERAIAKGIAAVVFDRGGFKYHGKVKAFADAARESGLKF